MRDRAGTPDEAAIAAELARLRRPQRLILADALCSSTASETEWRRECLTRSSGTQALCFGSWLPSGLAASRRRTRTIAALGVGT